MSTIADYRSDVMAALEAANLAASRTVTVMPHAGKFTFDELARKSHQCPAVFFTVLGWREPTEREEALHASAGFGNGKLYKLRLACGIVTKNKQNAEARNLEAEFIAEQISNLLGENTFDRDHIAEPTGIKAEGLFLPQAERNGLSMWVVGWEQVAGLVPFDAATQLEDFLVAYGRMEDSDGNLLVDNYQELQAQDVENAKVTEDNSYHTTTSGEYQIGEGS